VIGAAEDNKTNLLFLTFGALMLPMGSAGFVVAKTASELATGCKSRTRW
jgi:hypothetical protein